MPVTDLGSSCCLLPCCRYVGKRTSFGLSRYILDVLWYNRDSCKVRLGVGWIRFLQIGCQCRNCLYLVCLVFTYINTHTVFFTISQAAITLYNLQDSIDLQLSCMQWIQSNVIPSSLLPPPSPPRPRFPFAQVTVIIPPLSSFALSLAGLRGHKVASLRAVRETLTTNLVVF